MEKKHPEKYYNDLAKMVAHTAAESLERYQDKDCSFIVYVMVDGDKEYHTSTRGNVKRADFNWVNQGIRDLSTVFSPNSDED